MNKIKKLGWILLVLLQACSGKNETQNKITQESVVQAKDLSIVFDATKKADQNAAEVFDLGSVGSSGPIKKLLTITNTTTANLALSFTDLQTKIAATTRFGLNLATVAPCGATLKVNKSCSIELTLNNVANESYDAITTNILSGQTNPNFGVMMFSGVKSNDTTSSVPLSGTIRLNKIADSFSVPANGAVTKRFYIGNIGSKAINTPTIVAPINGSISLNSCTSLPVLKINATCFFEITYSSDLSPAKASLNDQVKFTSNDPLIDTTGLVIDLAITNQPVIVPTISANFNQLGSFKSTSDAASTVRLYVNNTGSSSLNASAIAIPSPYTVASTSCTSALKVGKTCYIDLKLDTTKTVNMTTQLASVSVGSSSVSIKAGTGSATTCASGYTLTNGSCTAAVVISAGVESLYFTLNGVGNKLSADGTLVKGLLANDTQSNGGNNLRSGYGIDLDGKVFMQDFSFGYDNQQLRIFDSILQVSRLISIPVWADSQGMMQNPSRLRWFHNLGTKVYFEASYTDSVLSLRSNFIGSVDGDSLFMTDSTITDTMIESMYGVGRGIQEGDFLYIVGSGSLYNDGDQFIWLNGNWIKAPLGQTGFLYSYDIITDSITKEMPDSFYQIRNIKDSAGKLFFNYSLDSITWSVNSFNPVDSSMISIFIGGSSNNELDNINDKLYIVDYNGSSGIWVFNPNNAADGSNPHVIPNSNNRLLISTAYQSGLPSIGSDFFVGEHNIDYTEVSLLKINTINETISQLTGSNSTSTQINNAKICDGQIIYAGDSMYVDVDGNQQQISVVWVYDINAQTSKIIDQVNYESKIACVNNNKAYYVGQTDLLLHEYVKGTNSSSITVLPGYESETFIDSGLIVQKP